jgi:hypothetical protein
MVFGNMIRAHFLLHYPSPLVEAIITSATKCSDSFPQQFRIKFLNVTDGHSLQSKLEQFAPVVELAISHEDQLLRDEARQIPDYFETKILAFVAGAPRFANCVIHLNPIDAVKAREMSDQDYLRTSLEPFAARERHFDALAAKAYQRLFYRLSAFNGPWRSPEAATVEHRKISRTIVGHFFRF